MAEGAHAPVSPLKVTTPISGQYQVKKGDTLYAVAWRYDKDFHELARLNHLQPPYALRPGQYLKVAPPKSPLLKGKQSIPVLSLNEKNAPQPEPTTHKKQRVPAPEAKKVVKSVSSTRQSVESIGKSTGRWLWPTHGTVIEGFNAAGSTNKGLDIAGRLGQEIRAAAPGIVVYSGNGLRGYGNLVIIKHDEVYLSAYAHNRRLRVNEGQRVKAGQIIAEMGSSGANRVMLHFEIRQHGKPINPMKFLKHA